MGENFGCGCGGSPARGILGPLIAGGLSVDQAPEGGGVTEVAEDGGGLVGGESLDGVVAGGDGEGLGADDAAASDVVWGIADDPDAIRREIDAGVFAGAAQGVGAEIIAVFAVVGEGAEGKEIPEAVVAEFGAGAALDVAREQGLGDVGAGGCGLEQRGDAGKDVGAGIGELDREGGNVAVEEAGEIFLGDGQVVAREDLAEDVTVGAAGVVDVLEGGVDAVELAEGRAQGAHAGAAGGKKGAVDVPKEESFHVKQKLRAGVTELRIQSERVIVSSV